MYLAPEWKKVVKKAWSFRLAGLAGVLTACEVVLPLFVDDLPRHLFVVLSFFAISAAMVARVVAQKDLQ